MRRVAEYPFDKSRISPGFLSGIDQIDHAWVKLETKVFLLRTARIFNSRPAPRLLRFPQLRGHTGR
ncbi:hypothetical protein BTN45_17165 [Rhizobium sp. ZX09]|nr:hypothetical protein BTN45_17165 [Rhizobium sp. ZX09]RAL95026.1 hypothetical protein DOU54_23905 [Agrobacterium sp. MS2]